MTHHDPPLFTMNTQSDWRVRPPNDDRPHLWRWIVLALGLVMVKFWLVFHLPIHALNADRDNLRYIILATNLIDRDTTYDAFALLRQPGYPVVIALAHWLGIPLRLWQEGIYLVGGAVLAAIVATICHRPRVATLCFGLYAFAPFSFHWNRQTLQEVLYLPLMALWLGAVIAVIRCRGWGFWLGVIGQGIVLAVLWNTRPEGVLLVPAIGLVWAIVAWQRYREQCETIQRRQRERLEAEYRDRLEAEARLQEHLEREIEAQLEAQLRGVVLPPPSLALDDAMSSAVLSNPPESPMRQRIKGESERLNHLAIVRELCLGIGLTIAPVVILTLGICWSNAANFGLFATSDFKTPEFAAAYSALARVEGSPTGLSPKTSNPKTSTQIHDLNSPPSPTPTTFDPITIVPVPAHARAAIYEHSPTFRQLRPSLEIPPNTGWRSQSCAEGICHDYAGGFFFWALRDAVAVAGYYDSPDRVAAFYQQLANEVNTACDRGTLTCRSRRWGMVPAIRWQTIPTWLNSIGRLTRQLWQTAIVLKLDDAREVDPAIIALRQRYYAPITGEPAEFVQQRSHPSNQRKDAVITMVAEVYRLIFPIVLGLSVLGVAIELGMQLGALLGTTAPTARRPGRSSRSSRSDLSSSSPNPPGIPLTIVGVVIVAIACRIVTIAYIDVASWPVGAGDRYLRPLWPLLWFSIMAGLSYAVDRWRQILRPKL